MDWIVIALIIYVIIVAIAGYWITLTVNRHRTNLEIIQKDCHDLIDDLEVISNHIKEINKMLSEKEKMMMKIIEKNEKCGD